MLFFLFLGDDNKPLNFYDDLINNYPPYVEPEAEEAPNSKLIGSISAGIVLCEIFMLIVLDISSIKQQIREFMIPNIKYGLNNYSKNTKKNILRKRNGSFIRERKNK